MKLRQLFIAATVALGLGLSFHASAYDYQSVKGDMMQSRIYTLKNGLTVYLSVNKEKPRIQTYIAVRTGSRNDPHETTGLAHYLEHLMFKGTQQFGTSDYQKELPYLNDIERRYEEYRLVTDPARRKLLYHQIDSVSQLAAQYNIPNEYDKLMSSIGAEGTNAYTSNDVTCYVEDIPSNEVENWARIQSDRFQNMVIRGFHTELEAVYEEYNISLAKDSRKEIAAYNAKMYPGHPYGMQTTLGTGEHLKNPSITNIKNYFKRYYCPNNVAICMSGDFDPDQMIATIDKYFGTWKPNPNLTRPEYAPVPTLTAPTDTTVIGQEAENVMLGWKFEGAASLQQDTLDVISDMLSNGKAGLFDLNLDQKMMYLGGGAFAYQLAEYSSFIVEGLPKEGQTLEEVRDLMLGEIAKLKRGEFSDDLLPSVINNMKLAAYNEMESNDSRANKFVDAFINGKKWSDVVGRLDRISHITKQQIVDFANRHFLDNYVAVYKRQGVDNSVKKIDKPQITPIPSNRDKQSAFVAEIVNSKVEPIAPVFVDFKRDITFGKTKKGLPVQYIQNKTNGLFAMQFTFDFGTEADNRLNLAAGYLDYLGTNNMTAEQLKQQFYNLACSFKVSAGRNKTRISLSGLDENKEEALKLMEQFLANAKVDAAAWQQFVALEKKSREVNKLNQSANFSALYSYGIYGKYNPYRNQMTYAELDSANPADLVKLITTLSNYKHSVQYYGPSEMKQVIALVDKNHRTAKKMGDVPAGHEYEEQLITQNEILLAPYNAKNIYMRQFNNSGKQWTPDREPLAAMFNEYFGGGMNTVVFQELRESRGLAYNAYAAYVTPSRKGHPEFAMTHIISQNDKMMDCIRTFNAIVDSVPQSERAFTLAKQALMKRIATERTTKTAIFSKYAQAQELGIDYDINRTIYEALPTITLQDIVKFEQENMAHKPYRYVILGDEQNLDIKSLEKIGPIKRISTEEIFGH